MLRLDMERRLVFALRRGFRYLATPLFDPEPRLAVSDTPMRSLSLFLIALLSAPLSGCGESPPASPSPAAVTPTDPAVVPGTPTSSPPTEATEAEPPAEAQRASGMASGDPEVPNVEPAAEGPESEVETSAVPGYEGLPAPTRGRSIRLLALDSGERTVDGVRAPTVAVADAASRARLDELLLARARVDRGCRIELAIEGLVSMRCRTSDMGMTWPEAYTFEVGADGDVRAVEPFSLLHPGASAQDLRRRLTRDPRADPAARALYTRTGLHILAMDHGAPPLARLGWRELAPFVRADTALGRALAAEGLPLAPVGTVMPSTPATTRGLPTEGADGVLGRMALLPLAVRRGARYASSYGIVLPPGSEHSARGYTDTYWIGPLATLAYARTVEATPLRQRPGPRATVDFELPADTPLTVLAGDVDGTVSFVGPARWALVRAGGRSGWVIRRALAEAPELCLPDAPAPPEGTFLDAAGLVARPGGGELAWFAHRTNRVDGGPGTVWIHEVHAECALGRRLRELRVGSQVFDVEVSGEAASLTFTAGTMAGSVVFPPEP